MIHIKFTDLDKITNRVEKLSRLYGEKVATFLDELAKIGINTADATFSTAQYDGDNDVVVDDRPHWVSDNKLYITARGKSITFIEFGSGVFYKTKHPKALKLGFIRGQFGKKKGSRQTWVYKGNTGTNGIRLRRGGILTRGNPPAMAMLKATQDMKDNIEKIAKEIFYDRY